MTASLSILASIGTLIILMRHSATTSHHLANYSPDDMNMTRVARIFMISPNVRARSPHPLAKGGLGLHVGALLNNTLALILRILTLTWQ